MSVFLIGWCIPENPKIPVNGASERDYHPQSFWYYPWGHSITHKGVDIFATKGTTLRSATNGIVLYTGHLEVGGRVVFILGPKWRVHYYAHLEEIQTSFLSLVTNKTVIGKVGDSGNAKGKQPHLHYAIVTLIPYVWLIDDDRQGWKKMFYLNPIDHFGTQDL